MSTNPVYAFQRGDRLIRAHGPEGIEVFEAGRLVATHRAHPNNTVSFSTFGAMLYQDGYGKRVLVEPSEDPAGSARVLGREGQGLYPDGQHILALVNPRYPVAVPGEDAPRSGLLKLRVADGTLVWHADIASSTPRRVRPWGQAHEDAIASWRRSDWKPPTKTMPDAYPEVVIAPDGRHWALVSTDRLMLGCDEAVLTDVYWHGGSFYPQFAVFDARCSSVYLAGKAGVVRIGLDGEPLAGWSGRLPCAPYVRYGERHTELPVAVDCPVLCQGDEVLVALRRPVPHESGPAWYEVHRFDAETLAWKGRLEAMPPRRLNEERQRLLGLTGGGIAWVLPAGATLVLPGPDQAHWQSSRAVAIVGKPLPPRVPHPLDDPEYDRAIAEGQVQVDLDTSTPGQLRSLARFLLEELVSDRQLDHLILGNPEAFAPFADAVLAWEEADVAALEEVTYVGWWKVTRWARDAAVDAFVARLEADLAQVPVNEYGHPQLGAAQRRRIFLLLGVLTPRALAHLGRLGRMHSVVSSLAMENLFSIGAEGPAELRFSPDFIELIGEEVKEGAVVSLPEGVVVARPSLAGLERGIGCLKAPLHLISVDVSLIPGDPLTGSKLPVQHWFVSNCEECDEAIHGDWTWHPDSTGEGAVLDGLEDEPECEGDGGEPEEERLSVELLPYQRQLRHPLKRLGRLGGWPDWVQSPAPAGCPDCGRMGFFVGRINTSEVRGDTFDIGLFAFQCEVCGTGALVGQMT